MVKLKYSVGIATKMIFIVTFIVVSAIGVVVYIASDLFREDSVTKVQETNKDTAVQLAERVHGVFLDATEKMTLMAQFATRSASPEEAKRAIDNTLRGSDEMISFFAYKFNDQNIPEQIFFSTSESALAEFNLDAKKLENALTNELLQRHQQNPNELVLLNSSPQFGVPLFTISFVSTSKDQKEKSLAGRWWFRAEIRHDRILKLFASKKFVTSYLVDAKGKLMAHSEVEKTKEVVKGISVSEHPIVAKMLLDSADNHQMSYQTDEGEGYLGAYKKVGVAGIGVIAEVSEAKALATIERVQYRSFLVMIVVVCAAFILNFGFSQSLTSNLKRLFQATEQVVQGKFDVDLKVQSSDEIGALAKAFLNMTDGLKERDKIKGVFDKFHSKEVAKKLLSGEIKLGGERLHATVFFSDIRGFTSMSEKMTPDQVVMMLNEYFTAMVRIITKSGGIVDKYIGDAILAVWGVPENKPDDTLRAIKACLEMRAFVRDFSKIRKAKGQTEIKIGMGLHTGDVLAGNIGSMERLEYTVIGDTVNQASRIEGATKAVGADILISDTTYAVVKDHGIVAGPGIAIKAKGKSKPLIVHQVIGYTDEKGELITVLTTDEIEKIQSGTVEVEAQEEEKSHVAQSKKAENIGSTPQTPMAQSMMPQPMMSGTMTGYPMPPMGYPMNPMMPYMMHPAMMEQTYVMTQMPKPTDEDAEVWFVVTDPSSKNYFGPLSIKQIAAKAHAKQFDLKTAFVFKQGEGQMIPLSKLEGVNRRSEVATEVAQQPLPETVIRNQAQPEEWYVAGPNGETLGPYSVDDLHLALGKGNISRTTLVWKSGMENWISLYEIPGFDRRAA